MQFVTLMDFNLKEVKELFLNQVYLYVINKFSFVLLKILLYFALFNFKFLALLHFRFYKIAVGRRNNTKLNLFIKYK